MGAWVLLWGARYTRTSAADSWWTEANPFHLPPGGLRGDRGLLQGCAGGRDPGTGRGTSREGERLLLPVREGQRGGYTPPSGGTSCVLPSHLVPSLWAPLAMPASAPWPTPEPGCAPTLQRPAGQLGTSHPLSPHLGSRDHAAGVAGLLLSLLLSHSRSFLLWDHCPGLSAFLSRIRL